MWRRSLFRDRAQGRTVSPISTEEDAMGTSEYARPELLAEPDWVWEHQSETFVRVSRKSRSRT